MPTECDLTIHRKCESKVMGDCPISAAVPTVLADEPAAVSSGVRGCGHDERGNIMWERDGWGVAMYHRSGTSGGVLFLPVFP